MTDDMLALARQNQASRGTADGPLVQTNLCP